MLIPEEKDVYTSPSKEFRLKLDRDHQCYAVYRQRTRVVRGEFSGAVRIVCGDVSDYGSFVIGRVQFDQDSSVIEVFASNGARVCSFRFDPSQTIIYGTVAISADGQCVVAQLMRPRSTVCGLLHLIHVPQARIIWSVIPETGAAESYSFDVGRGVVYLEYPSNDLRYAYALWTGACLESDRAKAEWIQRAEPEDIISRLNMTYREMPRPATLADVEAANRLVDLAADRGLKHSPSELARAVRLLGELCESAGAWERAIIYYEQAIRLDPRVGVKKKLEKLRDMH